MMTEPIIFCDNLVKIFKVADLEVLALQGLDLAVQNGEIMGIVGASGSGKTTLMNVLGGLVRPSAGKVFVDGHDLLKLTESQQTRYRREKVGFVWQQGARNLIPYLNARENVELPMILSGQHQKNVREKAAKLLELVGLSDRGGHYLHQLSGGEQQRVAIAVSLANDPPILLADEPTGELDSTTALTIYDAFRSLNQELGITILIVSHDPTLAQHVHRVMAIRDGKAASETRRKQSGPDDKAITEIKGKDEEHFEELLVLDSAGRLQVPKAYRETLNIKRRVHMELVKDGLLIRPAVEVDPEPKKQVRSRDAREALGGVSKRFKWLKRGGKK